MNQEYSTLRDFIIEKSLKYKNKTVFQYYSNNELINVTYSDLLDDINALGTFLVSKGFVNQHIAILSENSYDWIRLFFAISFSGNVCVPIALDLGEKIITENLTNSDCNYSFCSAKGYKIVSDIIDNNPNMCIETLHMNSLNQYIEQGRKLINEGNRLFLDMKLSPKNEAAFYFTSGTTGSQKCVILTQRNLAFNIQSGGRRLVSAVHKKRILLVLPLTHLLSFTIMCDVFHFGAMGFISKGIKSFFLEIKDVKPDILGMVPLFLETVYKEVFSELESTGKLKSYTKICNLSNMLLKIGVDVRPIVFRKIRDKFGGKIQLIISGGAPLSSHIIEEFQTWGIDVIMGYGITECSPIISASEYRDSIPDSVGKALEGVQVIINNPDEKGIGEICIKGDTVMKGYYNNPIETKKALEGGMFHTGDVGYLNEDGYLFITGRIKNIIILSNGENVSPEMLEAAITEQTIVKEAVVYQKENMIVAEIYPNKSYIDKNHIADVERQMNLVIGDVNKKLPSYARIGRIVIRESEFPKNTSKKIYRDRIGG